jgi:hypothetical protein
MKLTIALAVVALALLGGVAHADFDDHDWCGSVPRWPIPPGPYAVANPDPTPWRAIADARMDPNPDPWRGAALGQAVSARPQLGLSAASFRNDGPALPSAGFLGTR